MSTEQDVLVVLTIDGYELGRGLQELQALDSGIGVLVTEPPLDVVARIFRVEDVARSDRQSSSP